LASPEDNLHLIEGWVKLVGAPSEPSPIDADAFAHSWKLSTISGSLQVEKSSTLRERVKFFQFALSVIACGNREGPSRRGRCSST